MEKISKGYFWTFLGLLTIVHIIGMVYIDIMEVDAAQYASISQEMLQSGEYLQVHHRHADYLDKPPLLFWLTSLSFEIFGISNFSFRIPSFLFLLIGLFSTFKLGELLYDKRTGLLAVLVLYSSQAYFLFSHDVRTDTILANVVILAIWQLLVFIQKRSLISLVIGAVAVGLAMLEKGPIGVMVPVLALGSQILYTRQIKVLWRWEWLLGLLIILLTLAPMSYGLYKQFGWHGLEFYFWTQSFGRITGQSGWQDSSTVFYFVHTFLWAFLPWMFIAYFGVGKQLVSLVKSKFDGKSSTEIITLAGFVLTFIAMSLSRYKLPHYVFVVFPLAAVITANTIFQIIDSGKLSKLFISLQWFIWVALWTAIAMLSLVTFAGANWMIIAVGCLLFIASFYFLAFRNEMISKLVYSSLLIMIGVNFMLNSHFYPNLLQYQAGSIAGKYVASSEGSKDVYSYNLISHGFDFYTGKVAPLVELSEVSDYAGSWFFTNETGLKDLNDNGVNYRLIKTFQSYPVTGLTMKFLNPETRGSVVVERYLIEVKSID